MNTLKYVKEKKEDFNQKFKSVETLNELCKKQNIKVNPSLLMDIEDVKDLHE